VPCSRNEVYYIHANETVDACGSWQTFSKEGSRRKRRIYSYSRIL
jgi:hypothetical protein